MIEIIFSLFRSQFRLVLGSILFMLLLALAALPGVNRDSGVAPWQDMILVDDKSEAALIQQALMSDKVWLGSVGWEPDGGDGGNGGNGENEAAALAGKVAITYALVGTAFDGGAAVAYILASDDRFLLATVGQVLENGAEVVEIREQSVVLRPAETSETINLSLYSYE
ncbi:MAG: hypothetical protein HON77_04050 [Gammaproteobacteria bacterium]|nr:hypothetical protein [Gammaproteobacteria bacterium]MBT7877682.1 hypothetical protein [Gammaproteobacteria bacterium]